MTKRKATRKKATRKKATRRKATRRKATRRKATRRKPPPGFVRTSGGLFAPSGAVKPVPASKLRKGFAKLAKEVKHLLSEIAATDDFTVDAIELTASFSAKGEFLGFGAGGAASIMFRFVPA